jgi:hypothetical protein
MKNGILSGALMLVLAFGVGCGDDDDDSGGSGDICAKSCAAAQGANCPNQDESACKTECEAMLSMSTCQSENRALIQCSANKSASDFECDSDGEAALKAGVCDAQATAAATCLLGGMGGAGGASGAGGAAGGGGGGTYTCQDGTTIIPEEWVCDGEPDCPDGDDEQGC